MRQAGEVTYADAHKERTNEGVIEFRSHSDLRRALDKLDGTDINGRKIRLVEDKPRRRRSYSGSRSRSVASSTLHVYTAPWQKRMQSPILEDVHSVKKKISYPTGVPQLKCQGIKIGIHEKEMHKCNTITF